MSTNLIKRGNRWFARFNVPQSRWADVGRALQSRSGQCREIVRTLGTHDHREARNRRDAALAAIRGEIDAALERISLRPLSDWVADWQGLALERRKQFQKGQTEIIGYEGPDDTPHTVADDVLWQVKDEVDALSRRLGPEAAKLYEQTALGNALSVAEASRRWLAEINGSVREQTFKGHGVALKLLGAYVARAEGWRSLEMVALSSVTRRVAGEFISDRRSTRSAATVQREFSTYSGLWRWAIRRGYTEVNPWTDQTAGLRSARSDAAQAGPRAYTNAELVALLSAGSAKLSPNGGGYGPALWDIIRLGLLTGARVGELCGLTCGDVIEDGTVIATSKLGKSDAAPRLIPLHPYAQAVIKTRMAGLPDGSPEATLWPECPAVGHDAKRGKSVSTRFVPARRRILGPDDGADLHSLRRNFMTAWETAEHAGGRLNDPLRRLVVGHKRGSLAADVYSEWTRLGRRRNGGIDAAMLATLRNAVEDAVGLGLSKAVLEALEATSSQRPAVVRVASVPRSVTKRRGTAARGRSAN